MCLRALILILSFAGPLGAETLYLVRHAEKTAGEDPGLTAIGAQRASDLALLLRDAGVRHVFSSDYRRTRDTAAPLATAQGLEVTIYDPRKLPELAERLKRLSGNAVVVGHSNTTPELVRLLGGAAEPLPEWEYHRVYQIHLDEGAAETVLLHLPPESVEPEL